MRRPSLTVFLLLVLLVVSSGAQQARRVELDNGLVIIAFENHVNPLVTLRIYVRTGTLYDHGREFRGAGISHYYEHLHADATTEMNKEEINIWDESLGGFSNAYTSRTHTCYHQVTTTDHFDSLVELKASTLLRQDFNEQIIESQRGIILKEINMSNDSPSRRSWYRFQNTIFGDNTISDPILGYPDLFQAVTEADLRAYYEERYTADRMIVVVGGALPLERMISKVAEEFGGVAPGVVPLPEAPAPELLPAPRYAIEYTTFQEAQLAFGFRTVPLWSDDLYALDVLMSVLESGRASRLYRALREPRSLVTSYSVSSHTPAYDAGQFTVFLSSRPSDIMEAYAVAYDEVMRLREELVSEEELERAKRGFLAGHHFSAEELTGQADRLGRDAVLGNVDFSREYIEGCLAVTAEELLEVARRYFCEDNLYFSLLWPVEEGVFDLSALADPADLELVESALMSEIYGRAAWEESFGRVEPGQPDTYFVYVDTSVEGAAPPEPNYPAVGNLEREYPARHDFTLGEGGATGRIETITLRNGLRLLLLEDSNIESVTVAALVDGGYRVESVAEQGAFDFMMRGLLRGTTTRSADEISLALEERGGRISAAGYRDYGVLSAKVLAEDAHIALELVTDLLLNPTFPEERLEVLREQLLRGLAAEEDSPFTQASRLARRGFFGEHPYAFHPTGTPETIAALDRQTLLDYHERAARPEGVVLAISGNIDTREMRRAVEALWGGVPRGYMGFLPVGEPRFPEESRRISVETAREQSVLYWVWPGLALDSPDRYRLKLLESVLAGIYLPNGRLHYRLRGEGLVYAIHAFPLTGRLPGAFVLYLGTGPGRTAEAEAAVAEELGLVIAEELGEDELQRGRSMVKVARYARDLSTAAARLQEAAVYVLAGLGHDFEDRFIEAMQRITPAELREYAAELFARPSVFVRYGRE